MAFSETATRLRRAPFMLETEDLRVRKLDLMAARSFRCLRVLDLRARKDLKWV